MASSKWNPSKDNLWLKLLLCLFALVSLLPFVIEIFDNALLTSDSFVIGEATKNSYSIPRRVNNFYSIVGLSIVFVLLMYLLLNKVLGKFLERLHFANQLKLLIASQLVLSVFFVLDNGTGDGLEVMNVAVLGLLLIEFLKQRDLVDFSLNDLKIALMMFIAVFLLIDNIYGSVLCFVPIYAVIRQLKWNVFQTIIIVSPLLMILSTELALISNQRGWHFMSYPIGTVAVVLGFLLIGYLRNWRKKSNEELISRLYAPLLLIGTMLFGVYSPTIIQSNDLFETANFLNPLSMIHDHGQIPMIDFVPSHLTSDFIWGELYSLFNGYSADYSAMIYFGFGKVLGMMVIYWFLKTIFKDVFSVFFALMFFPVLTFYIPLEFALILIPAGLQYKYDECRKQKYLYYLVAVVAALVFWKLDVGIASLGGCFGLYVLQFALRKDARKILLKTTIIGGLLGCFILGGYLMFNSNTLEQWKHYFGASQAHGISELYNERSNLFLFDYYLLPLIIGAILVVLIVQRKRLSSEKLFWPVIFLIGVYFFNIQRALVRHSFVENMEINSTSFAWLILVLFVVMIVHRKKHFEKLFLVGAVFAMLFSLQPLSHWCNALDYGRQTKLDELPELGSEKINRVVEDDEFNAEVRPLIEFFDSNLSNEQTFMDFSGSPLLYYYSQRRVPSVFAQYLQNTVDPFLQEENVKLLKRLDVPFVVFNSYPESYYANTDEIPGEVRYYKLTQFIYENYVPYKLVGKFHIWKRIGGKEQSNQELDLPGVPFDYWVLGDIPYYWSASKDQSFKSVNRSVKIDGNVIYSDGILPGDFIQIEIESAANELVWLNKKGSGSFKLAFNIKKGRHKYVVPISASYYLLKVEVGFLFVSKYGKVESIKFLQED